MNCDLINLAQFKRNIDEKPTLERVRETCGKKKIKKYCDRWRIKIIEFKRYARVRVIHFVSVSKRNETKEKKNTRGKRRKYKYGGSNRSVKFSSCKLNARFDYCNSSISRLEVETLCEKSKKIDEITF